MASVLDAYDEITHAEALEERLAAAIAALADRADRVDEREWLESARRRLAAARSQNGDVLGRVLVLPELRGLHGDLTRNLQSLAADAFEALIAALTALNERSPLIDVLTRNLKLLVMRRMKNEDFEALAAEIEKRLASSYVSRMLADESYQPIAPDVAKVRDAIAAWRDALHPGAVEPSLDRALREELHEASLRIAMPTKQALFLAEAALAAEPTLREQSGIFERPRRRPRPRLDSEAQLPLPTESADEAVR